MEQQLVEHLNKLQKIEFLGCASTSLEIEYSPELLVLNTAGLDGISSYSEPLLSVDCRKGAAAKGSRNPREVASSPHSKAEGGQ